MSWFIVEIQNNFFDDLQEGDMRKFWRNVRFLIQNDRSKECFAEDSYVLKLHERYEIFVTELLKDVIESGCEKKIKKSLREFHLKACKYILRRFSQHGFTLYINLLGK